MQYGGGVPVLWKYFIKFRYFLKDGFPKDASLSALRRSWTYINEAVYHKLPVAKLVVLEEPGKDIDSVIIINVDANNVYNADDCNN